MLQDDLSTVEANPELAQLLDDLVQKLTQEWPVLWSDSAHGTSYWGVEKLPSKNAFYHDFADLLNANYKRVYGLETAATKEIRSHTVRRILEEGPTRSFDEKTRDVLAVYLGYPSWAAYQVRTQMRLPPKQPGAVLTTRYALSLGGLVLLVLMLGGWYWQQKNAVPADSERLKLANALAKTTPTKISIRYDLRGLDPQQTYVKCGNQHVVPQREQGLLTFKVVVAQVAPVQLFVFDKVVCEVPISVESEGWESFMNLLVPIEKALFYHNGTLNFPRNLVPHDNREEYYPAFLNFHDYGVSADNLFFEARVLNNKKIGGQWAYDVSVDLIGSQNRAYFNVLSPDAVLYAKAGAAETVLSGSKNHDLRALGIKMDDWRVLSMKLHDHEAAIFVDGHEILRFPYHASLGDLKGIQFYMKGSGAVDWVRVTDLSDDTIKYFDDFIEPKVAAR